MTTIREVKKIAKQYGADISTPVYDPHDKSYTIYADAPNGKCWSDGELHSFVCRWFTYDKNDKAEQLRDLIERMSYGIEDSTEEI